MNPTLARLRKSVDEFSRCIAGLPEALFRRKIRQWTPRDVLAHLIGWNRYTILGGEQLRQRLKPFYYADAATDYATVNAASVRKYRSRVRRKLLGELEISLMELSEYLVTLQAREWDADFGIRRRGIPITIRNTVNALTRDYVHHRKQIEMWSSRVAAVTLRSRKGSRPLRSRKGSRRRVLQRKGQKHAR